MRVPCLVARAKDKNRKAILAIGTHGRRPVFNDGEFVRAVRRIDTSATPGALQSVITRKNQRGGDGDGHRGARTPHNLLERTKA